VYKLLLCVRYLQTRYLAFICIVSVMLGVATLIVVNAVMSGFSTKLKDRLHGMLSDIVVDTDRIDGLFVFERKEVADGLPLRPLSTDKICDLIMASPAGDRIEAIAPTIEVFAIMQFSHHGQTQTKPIRLIGVDPSRRAAVGGFSEYLIRQRGAVNPTFDLTPEALALHDWHVRRQQREDALNQPPPPLPPIEIPVPNAPPPLPPPDMEISRGMPVPQLHGVIPGYTLAHFRYHNQQGVVVEEAALEPGDAVTVTTIGGADLKPVWGTFVVADYIKTEMSEYDQICVYVPLEQLQKLRGMQGRCTALQIKLKNYDQDKVIVARELRKLLGETEVRVATWEENQGPLLAAIDVERGILNLLLFMIVGVAGFSILAIFTMIVSEKYRDIGILKSLGASSAGVMSIFLGYGLLLGTVGCAMGTGLGLLITHKINTIEAALTELTGAAVFPRDVYYFKEIPTNIDSMNVLLVNLGAVSIATVFSLLPAYRAARLHPVRALRFE
jgi:lipoprotein-releasing system permease protein